MTSPSPCQPVRPKTTPKLRKLTGEIPSALLNHMWVEGWIMFSMCFLCGVVLPGCYKIITAGYVQVQAAILATTRTIYKYTETHGWLCTSSNSSNQRLQGDCPRIVPGADDEHNSQGLRLHVNLVWNGEEVLLYGPRSHPLCQILDSQVELSLQPQCLKQLSPMFALKSEKRTEIQAFDWLFIKSASKGTGHQMISIDQ